MYSRYSTPITATMGIVMAVKPTVSFTYEYTKNRLIATTPREQITEKILRGLKRRADIVEL